MASPYLNIALSIFIFPLDALLKLFFFLSLLYFSVLSPCLFCATVCTFTRHTELMSNVSECVWMMEHVESNVFKFCFIFLQNRS